MALNSSGPISLGGSTAGQSINLENGKSATAQVSLNDTAVRNLAGVASGQITMPTNFYGKSNRAKINLVISSNTTNYNIFASVGAAYISGKTDVTLTINTGVIVGSTSASAVALDTGSGWSSGDTIKIINMSGFIIGCGGAGGTGGDSAAGPRGTPGAPGGPALKLQYATTIENFGTIGGGGGGGSGGEIAWSGGAGGGGGAGYPVGAGGAYYGSGFTNGVEGTTTFGGNGGTADATNGGIGGNPGQNGASPTGQYLTGGGGGGGGLGAWGGSSAFGGGAPGAAVIGNSYATWSVPGTRYGAMVSGTTQSVNVTVSSNKLTGYRLNTALQTSNYAYGVSNSVTMTINSGVTISGASDAITATYLDALDFSLPNNSPGDTLYLINNGVIAGYGGFGAFASSNGGTGTQPGKVGGVGGNALVLGYPTTITNNGIIAGGGGGGGSGAKGNASQSWYTYTASGGGGGGGQGYNNAPGNAGYVNGANGSSTNGGNGGNGYGGISGGLGKSNGVAGGAGSNATNTSSGGGGGGGGFGSSGGKGGDNTTYAKLGGNGGAGGYATSGAPTYATWATTGTRYGSIN